MGLALLPPVDSKLFTHGSPVGAFLLTPVVGWRCLLGRDGSTGEVEREEVSELSLHKESSFLFSKAKRVLRREGGASRDFSGSDTYGEP